MDEKRQIAILVAVAMGIGLGACLLAFSLPGLLEGDLVIESYSADLSWNGVFIEDYVYEVKTPSQYRMLFRFWNDPLSTGQLSTPYIEFITLDHPPGTIGYIKEYDGNVTLYGSLSLADRAFVQEIALDNAG